MILYIVLFLVAVQRIAELVWADKNTQELFKEGAKEVGQEHYPLMLIMHICWFLSLLLFVPSEMPVNWFFLGIYILLQGFRYWTKFSLGRFWTMRIIYLPKQPLVKKGPYRFLRHPNYWIVCAEIALLPLAFNAWGIAIAFSIANAWLLKKRIQAENKILEGR